MLVVVQLLGVKYTIELLLSLDLFFLDDGIIALRAAACFKIPFTMPRRVSQFITKISTFGIKYLIVLYILRSMGIMPSKIRMNKRDRKLNLNELKFVYFIKNKCLR